MSFFIDKGGLIPVLETADLIPSRPGIAASEFIRIERQKNKSSITLSLSSEVSGTMLIFGEGRWPFDEPFFVDRRLFMPFIYAAKNIKSKKIKFVFKKKDDDLVVSHGKRKATFIKTNEVPGYGNTEILKSLASLDLDDTLKGLIACGSESAARDSSVPYLNCVYIKPGKKSIRMYSTNDKVVYKAVAKGKVKLKDSIPFPLFLVGLLASKDLKKIDWRKKEVMLEFPYGQVWQSVPQTALKKFPVNAIDKVMEQAELKYKKAFTLAPKVFGTVIGRLESYLTSVRRMDWVLKVIGKKGESELLLEATLPQSIFREKLRTESPIGMDFTIEWLLDRLTGTFGYIGSNEKELSIFLDKDGRTFLKTSHIQLIIPRIVRK